MSLWKIADRNDDEGRALADRHYNRQKVGAPGFVPPGRCLVLTRPGALWVTSFAFAQWVKHEWAGAMTNSTFRRESGPLASVLIRSALAATVWKAQTDPVWHGVPTPAHGFALVTFVDPEEVRSTNPGYCYLMAGFERIGTTKAGLPAFGIRPEHLPEAEAPHGAQLGLVQKWSDEWSRGGRQPMRNDGTSLFSEAGYRIRTDDIQLGKLTPSRSAPRKAR